MTQQAHPKRAACSILPVPRERWETQQPQFPIGKKYCQQKQGQGKLQEAFFDSVGAEQRRCSLRAVLSARGAHGGGATPPGYSVKFISPKKVRNMDNLLMLSHTM